ncbi:twin-arginine translocation signal domain-containing protein [Desulfovibrio sp. OttesenSCG-928-G15]|nr:twin-arginine translocation signal domain-containing protein [Desulfovibrio sp. OttesenSCG-928-G15]
MSIDGKNNGLSRRSFIKSAAAGMGLVAAASMPAMPSVLQADTVKGPWKKQEYTLVDAHLHYLDFIQGTDGFEQLVKKMDEAGVSHAVLFGMPMAKQWDEGAPNKPTYYLSNDSRAYYFSATDYMLMTDYMRQPDEIKSRFFPFAAGINPNDKFAAQHLRKVLEDFPGVFCGIGELMSRHDDLTALTYGEPPRANHPALLNVYDLAAEYSMPVLIHHNIAGSYMKEPIYLQEMKEGLAHNRNTNIIWAHVGISRRVEIPALDVIADSMLSENANLYFDISWVVYDDYINKNEQSLEIWAALFEKHPGRFLIGSDKVGHWATYPNEITKYHVFLKLLSEGTRQKVCVENILGLLDARREEMRKIA